MPDPANVLPDDHDRASLIGRVYDPQVAGPCIVVVRGDALTDITAFGPTVSGLLEREDCLEVIRRADHPRAAWSLADLLENTGVHQDRSRPHLLSPIDLQVVKAAGVTFVSSMLERVIEEQAGGDSGRALAVRGQISEALGSAIRDVTPGSPEAAQVKEILQAEGLWSAYLEVGLGPDAEIFTKAPVLSSVGTGQPVGVLRRSAWSNPEPEVVLVAGSDGVARGATLGNDVNLRDFEGRSALLLGKAKDNNASCAVGPFIRLFDEHFPASAVTSLDVELQVRGDDGFSLQGSSSMLAISRSPEELLDNAYGDHHHYPDGFILFTGTHFSPVQDRSEPGRGFTHAIGDDVRIRTPQLGELRNTVMFAEEAPPWEFGIGALMANLSRRGLLGDRDR